VSLLGQEAHLFLVPSKAIVNEMISTGYAAVVIAADVYAMTQ
jgi:hypothetical protein